MPNGIIIIDKPSDWTASEFAPEERRATSDPAYPEGRLLLFAPHPHSWAAARD